MTCAVGSQRVEGSRDPAGSLASSTAILVPHYNHHRQFAITLPRLLALQLPLIVVDDGSSPDSRVALGKMLEGLDNAQLVEHEGNRGKGGAVATGLAVAETRGFSHVLQADADGQHCLEDAPKLLAMAQGDPGAIISALPVFSSDVPRVRLLGRRLTIVLNKVETLSNRVADAMCGLRVYPVHEVNSLLRRRRIGRRMQFDIQLMVEADWAELPLRWVESPVSYPDNGLSHFHYLRDNWDISRMHLRLLFGMLPRLPRLLLRHWHNAGNGKEVAR